MKKNAGRKERRRLIRANRISANKARAKRIKEMKENLLRKARKEAKVNEKAS